MGYESTYKRSISHPAEFWGAAAAAISWTRAPRTVLDDANAPFYRWFTDGVLNTCHNALDRHVAGGLGNQLALIYDSPVTNTVRTFTYLELLDEVARLAGVLKKMDVAKGDRVIIYMPMIPEAAMAMLACARIGAVHSVVFGGFAAVELANRIDDARPKVILTASCGIEPGRVIEYKPLVDEAIRLASHEVAQVLILQRPELRGSVEPTRDIDWVDSVASAEPVDCVPVAAIDPLYILYTSGTTGEPKGVLRDNGGHAVALAWTMANIYDVGPGDVFWAASDIGWIVGHTHIVYGALLAGCTTVIYEGKPVGTPDAAAFWRVVADHDVSLLLTAPTAIRAIAQADPAGAGISSHDTSSLRALFLSGERCDAQTMLWAQSKLGVPVIDHFGQTECCWPVIAIPLGIEHLPVKVGSAGVAVPGFDIHVLDEAGEECAAGSIGALAVKLPLPPGTLPTLWNADDRYREVYLSRYPGYFLGGDAAVRDDDGYFQLVGRIDDIINVAGHRLSTKAVEEAIAGHPNVVECAVIGVPDALKGQLPVGLVVLREDVRQDADAIRTDLVALVREKIGPVAAFKRIAFVDRLPKTRSGKILMGTMRSIAVGEVLAPPATVEDPSIFDEISAALASLREESA